MSLLVYESVPNSEIYKEKRCSVSYGKSVSANILTISKSVFMCKHKGPDTPEQKWVRSVYSCSEWPHWRAE